MKNKSVWWEGITPPKAKELRENQKVDILIIGGGLTGISLAYQLRNSKKKIIVVERNKLMGGVSSKTTGKINYLQGITYTKIKKLYDEKTAFQYLQAQKEAIEELTNIIKNEHIECDLEKVTSKLESKTDKQNIQKEKELLTKFGVHTNEYQTSETYGISVEDTYVFHPLKYLSSLASICQKKGIDFYEGANVINTKEDEESYLALLENKCTIKAKKIVLACHYPFFLIPFFLPIRTYLEKSYIRANPVAKNELSTLITTYPNIVSERFLKCQDQTMKLTLVNSHNISTKWNERENFAKLKELKGAYIWSNEDIMTYDGMPFIGKIKNNMFLATGYNTWGMTNGTLASIMLKDLIITGKTKYQKVFAPYRKCWKGKIVEYPKNLIGNAKSLLGNKLKSNKDWYPSNLEIKREKGKKVGIYHDEKGAHKVSITCPHLKCTLIFNEKELTWDCPCHASRFDIDGNCLKGPSKYNIKIE